MGTMMNKTDKLTCDVAAKGAGWAIGKLNKPAGQFLGRMLAGLCSEKFEKDSLFNAQLDYCHSVARAYGRDAARNKKLQVALLDLMELSSITGNWASQHFFRITYLQRSNPPLGYGEWHSYKWERIQKLEP